MQQPRPNLSWGAKMWAGPSGSEACLHGPGVGGTGTRCCRQLSGRLMRLRVRSGSRGPMSVPGCGKPPRRQLPRCPRGGRSIGAQVASGGCPDINSDCVAR